LTQIRAGGINTFIAEILRNDHGRFFNLLIYQPNFDDKALPMADIISLDDKICLAKEKKAEISRKRKVLAVRKVFQCAKCAFKCEKCGAQITHDPEDAVGYRRSMNIPYNFCETCTEEYKDYIERLKGSGDQDCYWHNEAWRDAWGKWIDYQGSVDQYVKSKEFTQLLNELKQTGPEE